MDYVIVECSLTRNLTGIGTWFWYLVWKFFNFLVLVSVPSFPIFQGSHSYGVRTFRCNQELQVSLSGLTRNLLVEQEVTGLIKKKLMVHQQEDTNKVFINVHIM